MKATIVDLRYKMKEILRALDKNEQVEILCHGKLKGILSPIMKNTRKRVKEHPFFGMTTDTSISVEQNMAKLRNNRYDNI